MLWNNSTSLAMAAIELVLYTPSKSRPKTTVLFGQGDSRVSCHLCLLLFAEVRGIQTYLDAGTLNFEQVNGQYKLKQRGQGVCRGHILRHDG